MSTIDSATVQKMHAACVLAAKHRGGVSDTVEVTVSALRDLCAELIERRATPVPAPRLAEVEAGSTKMFFCPSCEIKDADLKAYREMVDELHAENDRLLALLGPAGVPANEGLRPEVLAFAWQMELKLRKHDAKRGRSWQSESVEWLMNRAADEWLELQAAKRRVLGDAWPIGRPEFVSEAADVANFLWMAAVNAGAMSEVLPRAALSGAVPANGAGETIPEDELCFDCGEARATVQYESGDDRCRRCADIFAARMRERGDTAEACARTCEHAVTGFNSDLHEAYDNGARDCAKRIREKFAKTIAHPERTAR